MPLLSPTMTMGILGYTLMAVSFKFEVLLSLSLREYVSELSKHLITSIYENDQRSPKCLHTKILISSALVMKVSAWCCSDSCFLFTEDLVIHCIPVTRWKWPKECPMMAWEGLLTDLSIITNEESLYLIIRYLMFKVVDTNVTGGPTLNIEN